MRTLLRRYDKAKMPEAQGREFMNLKHVPAAVIAAFCFFFGVMYISASLSAPAYSYSAGERFFGLMLGVSLFAIACGIVFYLVRKRMPAVPTMKVKSLPLGMLGGMIGAMIGGVIMDVALPISDLLYYVSTIISGAIAASIFGRLTDGDKKTRGVIGCAFAFIAIMLGYVFMYMTPISFNGFSAAPYEELTFSEFLGILLEPVDYLLWVCGIGVGFLEGGQFLESRKPSS